MTEPSFNENFIETLDVSAVEKPRYWDVKIILSDDPMKPEYYLHKLILAAQSSFFRKLFYHEPKEVYEIGAVSKRGFEAVIGLMYGRETSLDILWWQFHGRVVDINNYIKIIEDTALYLDANPSLYNGSLVMKISSFSPSLGLP